MIVNTYNVQHKLVDGLEPDSDFSIQLGMS